VNRVGRAIRVGAAAVGIVRGLPAAFADSWNERLADSAAEAGAASHRGGRVRRSAGAPFHGTAGEPPAPRWVRPSHFGPARQRTSPRPPRGGYNSQIFAMEK
jgi:hypothetical protein